MCVITRGTGLSPLARTCSRTWTFLGRLNVLACCFALVVVFKNPGFPFGDNFPQTQLSQKCAFQRVFSAQLGNSSRSLARDFVYTLIRTRSGEVPVTQNKLQTQRGGTSTTPLISMRFLGGQKFLCGAQYLL